MKLTKFGRYFDFQRSKFYEFERTLYQPSKKKTLIELSILLKKILDENSEAPRRVRLRWLPKTYKCWGLARGNNDIFISKDGAFNFILIHEIAHLMTPPPFANHGYEFLMTYLYLQVKYNQEELRFNFLELLNRATAFGLSIKLMSRLKGEK